MNKKSMSFLLLLVIAMMFSCFSMAYAQSEGIEERTVTTGFYIKGENVFVDVKTFLDNVNVYTPIITKAGLENVLFVHQSGEGATLKTILGSEDDIESVLTKLAQEDFEDVYKDGSTEEYFKPIVGLKFVELQGENGKLILNFEGIQTDGEPTLDDIVATMKINDGQAKTISFNKFKWDSQLRKIELTFDKIEETENEQNVKFVVKYKGQKEQILNITIPNKKIHVEKVELTSENSNLYVGEYVQLETIIYPENATNKNVWYGSSDENVATVDKNGKVTAINPGNVVITVTTEDGNKTAKCNINVESLDQKAADEVIEKINALPTVENVTLEDKEAVEAARAAYDALTEEQKALVTNYSKLEELETKIEKLEADKAAADTVIAKINALPSVENATLENKAAVEAARTAYNGLSEDQKALVTNYDKLEALEERIAELEEAEENKQAAKVVAEEKLALIPEEITYDNLEEVKSKVVNARLAIQAALEAGWTQEEVEEFAGYGNIAVAEARIAKLEADKAAADEVIEMINELPTVEEVTLEDKEAVQEARTAYNGLSEDQKALVTNYDKLLELEARIAEIEEAEANKQTAKVVAEEKLAAIPEEITYDNLEEAKSKVEDAKAAIQAALEAGWTQEEVEEFEGYGNIAVAEARIAKLEADKAAADEVIGMINELPTVEEVTLEDKEAVEAARAAYDKLTADQKALVTNYDKLLELEARIAELEEAEANKQTAKVVAEEKLAAIPEEITYDNLEEAKSKVEDAKAAIQAALEAGWTQEEVEEFAGYGNIAVAEARIAKLAADKQSADEVIGMINELPTVEEVTLEDKVAVQEARTAYNGLSEDQKALVTNYDKLLELEARIAEIEEVDKTALNQKIVEAEALVEENYTAESWANLQTVLITAREVAADENATQDEVGEALANLTQAIGNLVVAEEIPETIIRDLVQKINVVYENLEETDKQAIRDARDEVSNITDDSWNTILNNLMTTEVISKFDSEEEARTSLKQILIDLSEIYYSTDSTVLEKRLTSFAQNQLPTYRRIFGYDASIGELYELMLEVVRNAKNNVTASQATKIIEGTDRAMVAIIQNVAKTTVQRTLTQPQYSKFDGKLSEVGWSIDNLFNAKEKLETEIDQNQAAQVALIMGFTRAKTRIEGPTTVKQNETGQYTAKVLGQDVTTILDWTTSDETIATIKVGEVDTFATLTANAPGTVTIIVYRGENPSKWLAKYDVNIEEVQEAGEVTVQFFYDDKGEPIGEVKVLPELQED